MVAKPIRALVTTLLLQRSALRHFYVREDQTARNWHHAVAMTLPRTGEYNNTKLWKIYSRNPASASSLKTKLKKRNTPYQVNDDIFAKLSSPFCCNFANMHDSFWIIGVYVKNRRIYNLTKKETNE